MSIVSMLSYLSNHIERSVSFTVVVILKHAYSTYRAGYLPLIQWPKKAELEITAATSTSSPFCYCLAGGHFLRSVHVAFHHWLSCCPCRRWCPGHKQKRKPNRSNDTECTDCFCSFAAHSIPPGGIFIIIYAAVAYPFEVFYASSCQAARTLCRYMRYAIEEVLSPGYTVDATKFEFE